MSKQIKIILVVGIVLVAAAVAYLLYPAGEPEAQQRGVTMENSEATE